MPWQQHMPELEQMALDRRQARIHQGDFQLPLRLPCTGLLKVQMREDMGAHDAKVLPRDHIHARETLAPVAGRLEQCWIMEVSLGAHDAVDASGGDAARDIFLPEHVPVCKHNDLAREVGAKVCDGRPVRHAGVVALLLARTAVNGQHSCAGRDDHACVREGAFGGV